MFMFPAGIWKNQTVAVKIIPHSPSAAVRVKNEVELSMQFNHNNVVKSFFYEIFDAMRMGDMAQMQVGGWSDGKRCQVARFCAWVVSFVASVVDFIS